VERSNEAFLKEGLRLVDLAEARGFPLRLLGAVAIRLHCERYRHLFDAADRPITDLDFMAYGRDNARVQEMLQEEGYIPDEFILKFYGQTRQIYAHPQISGFKVDVFFDSLSFCHVVPFQGRLDLDRPTITMTDVLLEKMQIVEINAKDLKDTIIMMLEHDLSDGFAREAIDAAYILKILSADWGFYYTVTQNLRKVLKYMSQNPFITPEEMAVVESRVSSLLERLEKEPKSMKWRLRARVGPKVKWYTEVEETEKF